MRKSTTVLAIQLLVLLAWLGLLTTVGMANIKAASETEYGVPLFFAIGVLGVLVITFAPLWITLTRRN